jgi:hypothetical protein
MKLRPALLLLILWTTPILWLIYQADAGHARWIFWRVGQIPGGDKLGHFVLYGGISFFANLVANASTVRLLGRPVLKWSVILIALATAEEFSQLLFRWRSFDLWDLAAGAAGVWCLGLLAAKYARKQAVAQRADPVP